MARTFDSPRHEALRAYLAEQQRQEIIDALPKKRPEGLNADQLERYEKAMAAVIRILVERSIVP